MAWDSSVAWVIRPQDATALSVTAIYSGTIFAASQNSAHLAVYNPYHVQLWDASSGQFQQTLEGEAQQIEIAHRNWRDFYVAAFDPTGHLLVVAGTAGSALLDLGNGHIRHPLVTAFDSNWAAFSPDGRLVAVSSRYYGLPTLWNAETGTVMRDGGWQDATIQFAFSADGLNLGAVLYGSPNFRLWDVGTGELKKGFQVLSGDEIPKGLALSPNGHLAAIGEEDGRIILVDINSGQTVATLDGGRGRVDHLAFSADGQYLATGGADGVIRVWGVKGP